MRFHLLLFACKYPNDPILVREKVVADGLVEQGLFILLQLLDFSYSHPVVLIKYTFQQIHVLLNVIEVVNDVFRVGEVCKYQSVVCFCAELLDFFQCFFMRREYQFYVAVCIASRYYIYRFFTNHVIKESWCTFLVEVGLDWRNSAIEEYVQFINEGDRT